MGSYVYPPPLLTPSQVSQYLTYIGLPPSYHPSANPTLDLAYLTTLFTHQITAIPYENLLIHYSPSGTVSLDIQTLFDKIITSTRGRGGYCMENALLFKHLLHALGFHDAYTVGVRIRIRHNGVPQGEFGGFVHLVIIVTLGTQRYALDVGFGGDGPTFPMPLVEGLVHHNSIGTQEIRYIRDFLPEQRFRGEGASKKWVYQYRNGRDKEWNSFYGFDSEFEFMEPDFHIISWFTSTSPENQQTYTPLAILFLRGDRPRDEDGVEEYEKVKVVGKVMMAGADIKRNVTGKTELIKRCVTEEERVEALKEVFKIVLTEEEVVSIRGRVAELGRKA
ncbi:hypothetical protein OQA88_13553 [Cercophora sp. LCS_1]